MRPGRLVAGVILLIIGIAGYSYYSSNSISESDYQTKALAGTLTAEDEDRYFVGSVASPFFGVIIAIGIGALIYGVVGKGTKKQKNVPAVPKKVDEQKQVTPVSATADPQTRRFCTHCGKEMDALANFCAACGKKSAT